MSSPAELAQRLRAGGVPHALELGYQLSGTPEPESAVRRLISGEPTALVLGFLDILGMRFECTPRVFVPRRSTTIVIERAVEVLSEHKAPRTVLDVGTGTGLIAISLALAMRLGRYRGIDIDNRAVELAKRNAGRLAPTLDVEFSRADLASIESVICASGITAGAVDLLICNPPFIPERVKISPVVYAHQPHIALFSGRDGMDATRGCLRLADQLLAPGGRLLIEHDPAQTGIVRLIARDHARLSIVGRIKSAPFTEFERVRGITA